MRSYATPNEAFAALAKVGETGGKVRAVFVQDHDSGLKLFASEAWYVRDAHGELAAFLLKGNADAYAQRTAGTVVDYAAAKTSAAQAIAAR